MHFGKCLTDFAQRVLHYPDIGKRYYFRVTTSKVCFLDVRAVDHQWEDDRFATAGAGVHIWNHNRFFFNIFMLLLSLYVLFILFSHGYVCLIHRSAPERSFEWGTDTVLSVRFNPGQPNVLATTARYVQEP